MVLLKDGASVRMKGLGESVAPRSGDLVVTNAWHVAKSPVVTLGLNIKLIF